MIQLQQAGIGSLQYLQAGHPLSGATCRTRHYLAKVLDTNSLACCLSGLAGWCSDVVEVYDAVDGDHLVQDCLDHQHSSMEACCYSGLGLDRSSARNGFSSVGSAVQSSVVCVPWAASALVGFAFVLTVMDLKRSCRGGCCV